MSAIGQTVAQLAASSPAGQAIQEGVPKRVAEQLGQWVGHLGQAAAVSWSAMALSGERCSFCEENALGECIACGDPCCIGHAHVSHRAELLCDECVGSILDEKEGYKDSAERLAFAYFCLTPNATEEELSAVYRARSKSRHPDRGGSAEEMSKLNQHYGVLVAYFERRSQAA